MQGYTTFEAQNGRDGVDQARTLHPNIIIMDIRLPVLSGMAAIRMLKSDPDTRDIPIIVVSADAMTDAAEKARECGCDMYLTKPVDIKQLLASVRTRVSETKHQGPDDNRGDNHV